jgi:hypothetical protein
MNDLYYQIYDIKSGYTLMTCPTAEAAQNMMKAMSDPNLRVRPIFKSEHPLSK